MRNGLEVLQVLEQRTYNRQMKKVVLTLLTKFWGYKGGEAVQSKLVGGAFLSLALYLMALSQANAVEFFPDAGFKTIQSLDVYAEKNTIHALYSGLDKKTEKPLVKYLHSLDAGKTWSEPVTVNTGISSVKPARRGNDFQVAAFGNKVMAIWKTKGGEPWTGKIVVALSRDFGNSWARIDSPVSEKYAKVDQGYMDVTADLNGKFHFVWLDDREEAGNSQGLRYASFLDNQQDAVWREHNDLAASVCTCCWSKIEADSIGSVHVLYREDKPRDMNLISSFDGGKSWQKSSVVWPFGWQFTGCPHQGGGLVITRLEGKDVLHAVIWNGKTSNRGLFYSQSNGQGNWAPVIRIGNDSSTSGDIAVIGNDQLGIVYTAGDSEKKQVLLRVSGDGGKSWSKELKLTRDGVDASHPKIVGTEDGFRVFWTEWLDNGDAIGMMSVL